MWNNGLLQTIESSSIPFHSFRRHGVLVAITVLLIFAVFASQLRRHGNEVPS